MSGDQTAKRLATEHLSAEGSTLVAGRATRSLRFAVWVVGYRDPERPGEALDGGGLVVTDDGNVHDLGSAPGSLDDLMVACRWPGAEPADVLAADD